MTHFPTRMCMALIATLACGTPALGQNLSSGLSFEGGRLGFEYDHYDDGAEPNSFWISTGEVSGDLSYVTGKGLGFQFGFAHGAELSSSDSGLDLSHNNSAELHVFHDVSDDLRVGGMLAYDSFNDGDWIYAIEGIWRAGRLRTEARLGVFDSAIEPAQLAQLNLTWDVSDRFSLIGDFYNANYDQGFGHYSVLGIGAQYDVSDRVRIYGIYGQHENDFGGGLVLRGDVFSAGVNISLGGNGHNDRLFTFSPFH